MSTTIETLLALTLPAPKTETVTIPRLVMPDGKPLTLELRQLTFNQVADLRARNRDFAVHTVLAGVKAPNLRDQSLREHFDAETPAEQKAVFGGRDRGAEHAHFHAVGLPS